MLNMHFIAQLPSVATFILLEEPQRANGRNNYHPHGTPVCGCFMYRLLGIRGRLSRNAKKLWYAPLIGFDAARPQRKDACRLGAIV